MLVSTKIKKNIQGPIQITSTDFSYTEKVEKVELFGGPADLIYPDVTGACKRSFSPEWKQGEGLLHSRQGGRGRRNWEEFSERKEPSEEQSNQDGEHCIK